MALLVANRGLNRFRDVLPCKMKRILWQVNILEYFLDDDTRIRLQKGTNDYINANLVQVPWADRSYILTQVDFVVHWYLLRRICLKGPLPGTSEHFWQMVWEQNSRVIVMLTRLIEKGSVSRHATEIFEDNVFFYRINVGFIIRIVKMKLICYLMKSIWKWHLFLKDRNLITHDGNLN